VATWNKYIKYQIIACHAFHLTVSQSQPDLAHLHNSNQTMASYLITGCARGLGLAMAEHLVTFPSSEIDRIFAIAHGESTALKALIQSSAGKVQFIRMDTSKEPSVKAAVAEVERILDGQELDVLIINAGQSFTLRSTTTM
jgi:NAD(P)-dependent dehydrogenase (short-subunit alcohol dehydrogenase family)